MNLALLTKKKQQLDSRKPLPTALTDNLFNWFRVELTYTSNALEGNTLTRRETAEVIEKGLTVGGKSLVEHLEATNHSHALDWIHTLAQREVSKLTSADLLTLHRIILKGIDDDSAGRYRSVPVRISGSTVVLPNPLKVPDLMDEFHSWLIGSRDLHPVTLAGEAHYRLVSIHPFVDGNGRTARLLMNLLLLMHGYPPAIVRKSDRLNYIGALEKAQLGGSKEAYEKIIICAVNRSLDIYLRAADGKTDMGNIDTEETMKIGELARLSDETISTIRHWTKEGLLQVAEFTPSGYQLYAADMVERCKQIKKLKGERLTLDEIKQRVLQ